MNKFRRIIYWIGLMIGICLFIKQVISGFSTINPTIYNLSSLPNFILATFLVILTNLFRTLAWNRIMATIGFDLPLRKTILGYTISFLSRYIPGSIWGYVSRSEWLFQRFNLPYTITGFASVLEILMTVISAIIIIGINYALSQGIMPKIFLMIPFLLLPIGIWLALYGLTTWSFVKNRFEDIHRIIDPIRSHFGSWLLAYCLYLLIWLSYGIILFFLIQIHIPLDTYEITTTTLIFTAAWMAGFLVVFIPSGLGIREIILTTLLISLLGFSSSDGNAIAIVTRFVVIAGEFLWVLIALLFWKNKSPM